MFDFIFSHSIRRMVMAVMKRRIVEAQKAHDDFCKSAKDSHYAAIERMEADLERSKLRSAEGLVDKVLSGAI